MDRERKICGLSLRHQRRILLLLPSVIVKKGEKNTEKHQNERRSLLRCFIRFEEIEFPSLSFSTRSFCQNIPRSTVSHKVEMTAFPTEHS